MSEGHNVIRNMDRKSKPSKRAAPISAGAFSFSIGASTSASKKQKSDSRGCLSLGPKVQLGNLGVTHHSSLVETTDRYTKSSTGDTAVNGRPTHVVSAKKSEVITSERSSTDGGYDQSPGLTGIPSSKLAKRPLDLDESKSTPAKNSETPFESNPSRAQTPLTSILSHQTPSKQMHKLEALPSPFSFTPKPRFKINGFDNNAEAGPSRSINHKITESHFHTRLSIPEKHIEEEKVNLRRIDDIVKEGYDLGERVIIPENSSIIEARKRGFEEEGIGVSPRSKKGIKWTGKGPPPPSIQLANLLLSHTSSLVLFYTSLQHTLFPTSKPIRRPRPQFSQHSPISKETVPIVAKSISPLTHLRSAPLHCRILELVKGRNHQAVMFKCEITAKSQLSKEFNTHSVTTSIDDVVNKVGKEHSEPPLLIIFQPIPSECSKLGTDPRTLAARWGNESGQWEAGIWGPYNEVELDSSITDTEIMQEAGEGIDPGSKINNDSTRVVFASRYLVAKAD